MTNRRHRLLSLVLAADVVLLTGCGQAAPPAMVKSPVVKQAPAQVASAAKAPSMSLTPGRAPAQAAAPKAPAAPMTVDRPVEPIAPIFSEDYSSARLLAARNEGATAVESFSLMVESLALFHAMRGDLAFLGASEMRGLSGEDLTRVTELRNEVQHLLDEQAAKAMPGVEVRIACRAIATMCTSLPSWFRAEGPLTPEQVATQYAGYAVELVSQRGGG